jgi:hypothetical protein
MALASVSVAGRYTWAHKGDEYIPGALVMKRRLYMRAATRSIAMLLRMMPRSIKAGPSVTGST